MMVADGSRYKALSVDGGDLEASGVKGPNPRRAAKAAALVLAALVGALFVAATVGTEESKQAVRCAVGCGCKDGATRGPPEDCKTYFDGCNECWRSAPGEEMACTRMFCTEMEEPVCRERFGPPDDCKVWFDGCNSCSREAPGSPMACTMMACSDTATAVCREHFHDEVSHDAEPVESAAERSTGGAPDNCAIWFDGCNRCRRSVPGASLACTRMMCPAGMRKPTACLKEFEP